MIGPFRVLQISIVVLMLFGSTWLVRTIGMAASPFGTSSTWLSSTDALAGTLQQGDNGDNDDGDNGDGDNGDNGDGDNGDNSASNNNSNSNSNTNDNDGGDDNDNDYDDNDNFDDFDLPDLSRPSSSQPARPPEPQCSTPGQDTVFTSHDEKVTVRVFANNPRPVRVEIYRVIDFLSAPLPPGNLVGLLAYELRASYCDTNPLTQFPAEVNLGIRYSDIEAAGLDENRFVIGHLDLATGIWSPVQKRGNDPAGNYTSATIIDTGFYMVWEAR